MKLVESYDLFFRTYFQTSPEDVQTISKICKAVHIPQRTISFSWYIFYAVKVDPSFIEPDDLTLFSSIIELACKLCEVPRSPDKILEVAANVFAIKLDPEITQMYRKAINKTKLDLCVALDFKFEVSDIYPKLQLFCKNNKLDAVLCKRCWILLSDMMSTPICIYFTWYEMIVASVFINFVANETLAKSSEITNDSLYLKFCKLYDIVGVSFECLDILMEDVNFLYQEIDTNKSKSAS